MTITDRLSLYWSREVAKSIANKTQIFLENQKDLTSGDDTCLANNWEEYCLQVGPKSTNRVNFPSFLLLA